MAKRNRRESPVSSSDGLLSVPLLVFLLQVSDREKQTSPPSFKEPPGCTACQIRAREKADPQSGSPDIHRRYSRLGQNSVSRVVGIKAVATHYSRISLAEQEMRLAVRQQSQKKQQQQHRNIYRISHMQIYPERHSLPTTLFPA